MAKVLFGRICRKLVGKIVERAEGPLSELNIPVDWEKENRNAGNYNAKAFWSSRGGLLLVF